MCLRCANSLGPLGDVARLHVLDLLALIEDPDALPHEAALRISREIMTILGPPHRPLRCDDLAADAATGEDL